MAATPTRHPSVQAHAKSATASSTFLTAPDDDSKSKWSDVSDNEGPKASGNLAESVRAMFANKSRTNVSMKSEGGALSGRDGGRDAVQNHNASSPISPKRDPAAASTTSVRAHAHTHAPSNANLNSHRAPSRELNIDDNAERLSIDGPEGEWATTASVRSGRSRAAASDKASRILGISHRRSMEPIPASTRTSMQSAPPVRQTQSLRERESPAATPSLPLTSLYLVSGLPKSPHTWTLADPDSVLGLHHTEGAVNRWWRPEVLGSTVSPGAGGTSALGKRKSKRPRTESEGGHKAPGALGKQEVGKMLSKALKVLTCLMYQNNFSY